MKRFSTFLAALLCTATAIFADLPFRNHRYDAFKPLPVTEDNIVFIGNSITNMHEWWEAFGDPNVVNRGVSGAVTDEALENIEAIAAGKPKKVFIMIGTNDLGTAGINTTEHVLQNVTLMVERFQKTSPATELYIQSILPSGLRDQALQQATNTALQALCTAKGITYIDLWDDLLGVATNANGLSYDKLHLTANAYKIWCDKIAPYVTGDENAKSVYTDAAQQDGGIGGSMGMRNTVFSKLPVANDDILIIGDEMVHGGEWHELLSSAKVKSRGTQWGYPGPSLADMKKIIPVIFHDNAAPAQVYLYAGVSNVNNATDVAAEFETYKSIVEQIKTLSPNTEITLMSLQPTATAATNTGKVAPFNEKLEAYAAADESGKVHYLDLYTDFVNNNVGNSTYFNGNYLYGRGYVKVAQKIAAQIKAIDPSANVTAITDAEAEALYARFTSRTTLGKAIVTASLLPEGDGVGQYTTANLAGVKALIEEAYTALKNNDTEAIDTKATAFTEAVNAVLPKINQPTYSTQGNEVWYQLYTPNRSSKYLSNAEAEAGVTGEDANNYPSSMWKFVLREDGTTLDIINRKTNAYLSPTAAGSTQLTTTTAQPQKGWTLDYSNAPGLFIVNSGNVQLHQTNNTEIWNWGGGTNRGDAGCQYMVSIVEGSPADEPTVPTDENFKGVVKSLNDLVDGWYKMRVVTGSDATMQGYITNGTNHVLNASTPFRQNATNFYPLKLGAYNTDKPATGWVKVTKIGNKYQIQSIGGLAIQENCIANRDITQGYTTLTMTYGGFTSVDKWHYYNPGANTEQPYIGKSSSSNNKFAFAPVSTTELDAYDIYTVTINADNATEIGSDPSITYTGTANIGGIAKVYNNGYMFFPKGIVPTASDFTLPEGLQMKVDASAKTLIVGAEIVETLTLTSTQFANGTSTYSYHGNVTSGSWYGKLVTGTTPALTIESTDEAANNIGWSSNQPWLKAGYTYNLSLPKGYQIVGYELTTKQALAFTGTFTYTTAQGTTTSAAQSGTEQTVSAEGLSTSAITLKVGENTDGTKGILITKLIIRYKEVEGGEETPSEIVYTIDKTNGDLYRDGNVNNNSYTSIWKSTAETQLQFGTAKNNMNWSNDNVQLMSGDTQSSTYTLTAPAGYVITEYSFTFANNNHETGLELTMDDGRAYTTQKATQTISANNIKVSSVSFVLKGANGKGVILTSFTVKVKKDVIERPKVSTADNVYWYYITSASTQTYCAGKVMYYDAETQKMRFGDKDFKPTHVWSFWEQNGKLAIKNYNGQYFGTAPGGTGGGTTFGVVDNANYIYNVNEAHGFFIIKDNNTEFHAQSSGQVIVRWGADAGNASLWRFDEVDVSNAAASLASAVVVQGKVTTGIGNIDQPIIRSTLRISGLEGNVDFQGVKGRFEGTNKADVTNVKAYFATNDRELFIDAAKKMTWREENGVQYGEAVTLAQDGTFTITGNKTMEPGDYYLWITYDIAETAKEGNLVDAVITGYTVDGKEVAENNGNPRHSVTIFLSEGAVLMPMDKGSLYYRIPAITVTKDGKRLVVLTDDRKAHNSDLPSHCYLVAQYSDDNGRTWSNPVTVAGTAETGGNYGHGDASIVTDRNTGNIIGIMTSCAEYGHGFFAGTAEEPPLWKTIVSKDGGITWSVPKNHTASLFGAACDNEKTKTWKSGFSGSGAALQKRDGTLVSSFVNREADNSQNFYFFMSKDGGENWYVSGTSGTKAADEPKTLERNNGDLAISVRASGYNYYNVTSDNGQTWHNASQTRFNTGISGNACDGEYMVWCSTLEGNPWNIAFQTIPNSGSRENVSIALSTDEGATFGDPKTICPSGSAYSATVVLPDGTVGCYYEENGLFGGYTMRFVRFSLDWASNGQYKFTEENPFKPIKSVEPAAVTSTISEHKIGTFYANDPVNIPEGVKAYAAIEEPTIENGEGVLKMTEIEDIIPAHTGVVIRAEKGDYSFTQASTNGTVVNGNMLVGYAGPAEYKEVPLADGYTTYVLATKSKQEDEEEKVGFYRKDAAFKVYNHKAYLNVPKADDSAPALAIRFEGDGSTGIENSELKIENSEFIYDLMGRRVENPTKGVYIVGGRKVVIK